MEQFILRALIAGIGVAVIAGALGCFVVWRRMAYFGDSLAHSTLLGVSVGILLGTSVNLGILIVCGTFAIILVWLEHKRFLAMDTLLGIFAHSALSIGMVVMSFLNKTNFDLHGYLFGDILTVGWNDIYWIYGGGIFVLILLIVNWEAFILMTIHQGLAKAEGIKTFHKQLLLMLLLTVVVAVSIRIVGMLLVTSMLIIPAATARQITRSPEAMVLVSSLLGVVAVALGMWFSFHWDIPSGPAIVSTSSLIFLLLLPFSLMNFKR